MDIGASSAREHAAIHRRPAAPRSLSFHRAGEIKLRRDFNN